MVSKNRCIFAPEKLLIKTLNNMAEYKAVYKKVIIADDDSLHTWLVRSDKLMDFHSHLVNDKYAPKYHGQISIIIERGEHPTNKTTKEWILKDSKVIL